ncbi:MAG: hypothetical protein AB7H71_06515 [Alphaproteobacteria bacterium]
MIRGWPTTLIAAGWTLISYADPSNGAERFQADQWRAECEGAAPGTDCSVIVTFRPMRLDGSYALAVNMRSGIVAIVGDPPPLAATLQIDHFPKIRCSGPQYCLFPIAESAAAAAQLAAGSIALVDVETKNGVLHSSLSTNGYRAALAKIWSWRNSPAPRAP